MRAGVKGFDLHRLAITKNKEIIPLQIFIRKISFHVEGDDVSEYESGRCTYYGVLRRRGLLRLGAAAGAREENRNQCGRAFHWCAPQLKGRNRTSFTFALNTYQR
jgi:hypothetical protein